VATPFDVQRETFYPSSQKVREMQFGVGNKCVQLACSDSAERSHLHLKGDEPLSGLWSQLWNSPSPIYLKELHFILHLGQSFNSDVT
jgi:hypothetical protein